MSGPARSIGSPSALTENGLSHWEGEPLAVWASLWSVPRFEAYATVRSTNDRVRELASEGAPPFTVVTAEEQTAGRGRNGRSWASAASKGLWISVLLRAPNAETRPAIPILMGLAACRAVEQAAPGLTPVIKWPNDVLLGDRKVCGVLCEAGPGEHLVAGVGMNVRHRPADFPDELRPSAVSLAMASGRDVSRASLAGALVSNIRNLLSGGGPRLEESLLSEIGRRDALRGRRIGISEGPTGVATGIDEQGRLRVRLSSGERVDVVTGSVTILDR
jgi:BirA family biotin operon repressor/biotin-[acetyl-CoA-carboxylase] ligase